MGGSQTAMQLQEEQPKGPGSNKPSQSHVVRCDSRLWFSFHLFFICVSLWTIQNYCLPMDLTF